MIPLEECAAVLLCAGRSRRFGPGNKLLEPVDGKPLLAHAADLCARLPFAARLAVVPPDAEAVAALIAPLSFDLIVNPSPEAGKDSSLRLGLAEALAYDVRAILVLLGDMPHVHDAHVHALAAAASDGQAAISRTGETLSPPTLFPARIAQRALERTDQPVRHSLGRPACVAASASTLADYDFREQFQEHRGQR